MAHHRRRKFTHQPGYLEAKACRLLTHAKRYVRDRDGFDGAWLVLQAAYLKALDDRVAAVRVIRGY